MNSHILAVIFSSLAVRAHAGAAPAIKVAKVFHAPVSAIKSLADLRGKVVFLEFWATWCGPCVAGVPRTNRLIDALAGEPVVFLAVTDEPADKIEPYLTHHEMKAWVGVDEAHATFDAYHVRGRPSGYLIGKNGELLARIFPDRLSEEDVRSAIAGKFKRRPVAWDTGEVVTPPARAASLFEIAVTSGTGKGSLSMDDTSLTAEAMPFTFLVSQIWGVAEDQIVIDRPPVEKFGVRLKTPEGKYDQGRDMLKSAVEATFDVTAGTVSRETDVYLLVLSTAPGAPRPTAGEAGLKSGIMASGGGRILGKVTMAQFAKLLWESVSKPVIDATGLSGEYFLDLEWKKDDFGDLGRLLAGQGLLLLPGRRAVEFLEFSSRSNSARGKK